MGYWPIIVSSPLPPPLLPFVRPQVPFPYKNKCITRHSITQLWNVDVVLASPKELLCRWLVRTKMGSLDDEMGDKAYDVTSHYFIFFLFFVRTVLCILVSVEQIQRDVLEVSDLLLLAITILDQLLDNPILVRELFGKLSNLLPERQWKDGEEQVG